MGIENQIAQFGMNAGRGIQNTVNNALARNEDRRRYENSLSLAKQQQAMAGEAAADAAEREYSAGGVQAYMSSGKDPRILQGWAQGAVQRGYITPEEASAFDDGAMMRLAAEVGHDFSRKDVKLPSNVQEWEYYSQLPQDKQNQYLNMKRAGNMINLQDKMVYRGPGGDIQGAYPVGIKPSDTVGHRVSVKRGESEAAADVQERVGAAKLARQNERVMATYESAIGGLLDALEETETGPAVGRLPAVTAKQQTAEGAISAMAPVLKSLFRSAGEGTFTDKDQALLLEMLPTRKDLPEARRAKIANVDAIVRAKLGGDTRGVEGFGLGPSPSAPPPGYQLMEDANGNKAYVGPNGEIQEL